MSVRRSSLPARLLLLGVGLAVAGVVVLVARPSMGGAAPNGLPSVVPPATRGGDVYVAPNGDDAAAGIASAPLRSVAVAAARVAAGGTVWLDDGTYPPIALSGTSGIPTGITIAARTAGNAIVAGGSSAAAIDLEDVSGVRLFGLDVRGPTVGTPVGILIDRSTGVTVEGGIVEHADRGFGIEVRYAANVTIHAVDIRHNAVGIRLYGQGDPGSVHDVVIDGNLIHDSDSMVVDDPAPDNDFGGNGIIWHKVTGATIARNNRIWATGAPSHDYGVDGGAFEIWGSANMTITGNTVWHSVDVLETGSDGPPCSNLLFTRNIAYEAWPGAGLGLILRCAEDGLVAGNVVDSIGGFAFELSDRARGGSFATSVDGLRILDNIIVGSKAYVIRDPVEGVTADHNLFWDVGSRIATTESGAGYGSLAELTRATGYDAHSILADPEFVDPAAHDYRLVAGSPAIDAGVATTPGQSFDGNAPDIGAFEGAATAGAGDGAAASDAEPPSAAPSALP